MTFAPLPPMVMAGGAASEARRKQQAVEQAELDNEKRRKETQRRNERQHANNSDIEAPLINPQVCSIHNDVYANDVCNQCKKNICFKCRKYDFTLAGGITKFHCSHRCYSVAKEEHTSNECGKCFLCVFLGLAFPFVFLMLLYSSREGESSS